MEINDISSFFLTFCTYLVPTRAFSLSLFVITENDLLNLIKTHSVSQPSRFSSIPFTIVIKLMYHCFVYLYVSRPGSVFQLQELYLQSLWVLFLRLFTIIYIILPKICYTHKQIFIFAALLFSLRFFSQHLSS